ncbi:DUF5359 family protein [Bacillus taeanensis]|uniref:Uncharacterized protein n=1 Tax=Bacillus taeanensis TaxID=273032 RepID=A0A366Y269_9BACI|nr:DUF5359 family protein [Bacillus taeanensis]RBW70301.1 hypothetical protein DS031_06950 [Bacillus taeanensis]
MNRKPLSVVERLLVKLIIIQFICLVFSQCLLKQEELTGYLNKTIVYEGVSGQELINIVETLDQ